MDAETLDGMTLDALDRTFEQLVALLHVTHSHILSVVTAIEDRQMPVADGAQSLGSWISAHAGLHRSTGERWAVASSKLKELPCVASAFESGALSFDQLSEVVRLATPETDAQWAEDAPPRSAASLRAMARDAERVTRQKEEGEDAESSVRLWKTRDGRGSRLDVTLFGVEDETVVAELLRLAGQVPKQPDGTWLPIERRLAMAFGEMAGASSGVAADPAVASITIFADKAFLDSEGVDGVARFGSGKGLSIDRLRCLACDCRVAMVALDEHGNPQSLTAPTRTVPRRLRDLVMARDQHCTFPGCEQTRHLHMHHIQHWVDGGPTAYANLTAVCSFHHHNALHAGWNVALTGRSGVPAVWTKPDGTAYTPGPRPLHPRLADHVFGRPPDARPPGARPPDSAAA